MKKGDSSITSKKQAIKLFKQKISDVFTPSSPTNTIPTSNPTPNTGTSVTKDFEYRDYTTAELYEMIPVSPQSSLKITLLDKKTKPLRERSLKGFERSTKK